MPTKESRTQMNTGTHAATDDQRIVLKTLALEKADMIITVFFIGLYAQRKC